MNTNINQHGVQSVNIKAEQDWIDIEVLARSANLGFTLFTKDVTLDVLQQMEKDVRGAIKAAERRAEANKILFGED